MAPVVGAAVIGVGGAVVGGCMAPVDGAAVIGVGGAAVGVAAIGVSAFAAVGAAAVGDCGTGISKAVAVTNVIDAVVGMCVGVAGDDAVCMTVAASGIGVGRGVDVAAITFGASALGVGVAGNSIAGVGVAAIGGGCAGIGVVRMCVGFAGIVIRVAARRFGAAAIDVCVAARGTVLQFMSLVMLQGVVSLCLALVMQLSLPRVIAVWLLLLVLL